MTDTPFDHEGHLSYLTRLLTLSWQHNGDEDLLFIPILKNDVEAERPFVGHVIVYADCSDTFGAGADVEPIMPADIDVFFGVFYATLDIYQHGVTTFDVLRQACHVYAARQRNQRPMNPHRALLPLYDNLPPNRYTAKERPL